MLIIVDERDKQREGKILVIEAIDYYLNEKPQTSWPPEKEFVKSRLNNGRYYLEAIKSDLKAVEMR